MNQPIENRDKIETLAHLAGEYSLTASALRLAVKRGRLWAYKSGTVWLTNRKAVEEYLRSDRRRRENRHDPEAEVVCAECFRADENCVCPPLR